MKKSREKAMQAMTIAHLDTQAPAGTHDRTRQEAERRVTPRLFCNFSVTVEVCRDGERNPRTPLSGRSRNVSLEGALVLLPERLSRGARVVLVCSPPAGRAAAEIPPIVTVATVVWTQESRAGSLRFLHGLRFSQPNPELIEQARALRGPSAVSRNSGGERGIVLISALLVMTFLLPLGVIFFTLSLTQSSIAENEISGAKAFNLAEAGLAVAKRMLRDSGNWDDQLTAAQPFACPTGLVPPSDGGCTFKIENDAADPGGPMSDTNNLLIVTATGTYGSAKKEVEFAITQVQIPEPPGGMTSVGVSSDVSFNGNSFSIDGNNWIPPSDDGSTPASQNNGACGSIPTPKFGIAVPDATHQLTVKNALNNNQQDNVTGATPNPPWTPFSATPSIGVDATLTQSELLAMVGELMPLADPGYTFAPGTHLSNATLGTQADPKIVVVDATTYSGSDPALALSSTDGAGILIVLNGTLKLSGSSQWVGIIIVVGSNVSIRIQGGGNKSLYGAILLAEDANVDSTVAEGGGSWRIRYSCQGVATANSAGGGKLEGATAWWREVPY